MILVPFYLLELLSLFIMKKVEAYTDGSSLGNPGPGGYGAILVFVADDGTEHVRELSQGFKFTTNGRMEIMGVLAVLEALNQPCDITITSDSKYVVDSFEKNWLESWAKKGWKKADKKPVLNQDLWKKIIELKSKHNVTMNWVKGHAGHPMNERCDELARQAAASENLPEDAGYVKG